MKNKFLIILALGLFIPVLVNASWYNPLSWFEDNSSAFVPEKLPVSVSSATQTDQVIGEKIRERIVEKIVEKPVDRVVEKIVTTDNPKLKAEIDRLTKENSSLKERLTSLTLMVNQCREDKNVVSKEVPENNNLKNVEIALAKLSQISVKIDLMSKDPNNVSDIQASEVYNFKNIDNEKIIPPPFSVSYPSVLDWIRKIRPIIQNEKSRLLVLQAEYK